MVDVYDRYQIERPPYLPEEHWRSVEVEVKRLDRSLEAEDYGQALSDLKCLVEAVAKVTLDIAGEPAGPTSNFDTIVNRAHGLLATQPGRELANTSHFGKIATQASKIARNLANIRNDLGGGHGRSRQPEIREEMIDLALDGGLIWTRWALRRLGYFSEGRPENLIRDLIEERAVFHSGELQHRLEAANLPNLEPHHQQSIGVAVGQRVMRETFVVRWDGLDPCLDSDDLTTWTRSYRIGLAYGLWFDPEENVTLTTQSLQDALLVMDPIADAASDLAMMVDQVISSTPRGSIGEDGKEPNEAAQFVRQRLPHRPAAERPHLEALADHLDPGPQ